MVPCARCCKPATAAAALLSGTRRWLLVIRSETGACQSRRETSSRERHLMPRYRVAVDTGGTFSDFVYLNEDTGAVAIGKVASTPDDPSQAILQGVEALIGKAGEDGAAAEPTDVSYF